MTRFLRVLAWCLVAVLAAPTLASAHEERKTKFPSGKGSVPEYRTTGPYLVVCKPDTPRRIRNFPPALRQYNERLFAECLDHGFRHLQAAVDAVARRGTRILVQPGHYFEGPSLGRPTDCAEIAEVFPLSYPQQRRCPNLHQHVGIMGDGPDADRVCDGLLCDLQIEGTGRRPTNVIFDGRYRRLNVIRADRADGIYFRNFTVQRSEFNSVYVIETDGFVIDRVLARWNDEYGFLTFASDHGLYHRCRARGNGDAGVYPGSAAPHYGARPSIEIRHCRSFHNSIGISGTAGDSLYVHHNRLFGNSTGVTLDSFFPDHPGLPQNNAVFVNNVIHGNNVDFYQYYEDGTCQRPIPERGYERGVVCPAIPVPIGTGIMVAGGNQNLFARNRIFDNWRQGAMLFWVPAAIRNEDDPDKQYDTSHFNRYVGNRMGVSPRGVTLPNALDFWWDEEGAGNCWQGNRDPGGIQSDPSTLPDCDDQPVFSTGNPAKTGLLAPCSQWSRENHHPEGCDWMDRPERPSSAA